MGRITASAALLSVGLLGCGSTADLVYVADVTPFDGVTGVSTTSVDTVGDKCANATICKEEPFGEHYARITVVNDFEKDPDNPAFGRRVISHIDLEFNSLGAGPQLPKIGDIGTRVVLEPQSEIVMTVILAGVSIKDAVGSGPPELYEARYLLSGPDGLDISGSATVSIGNFNACDPGYSIVAKCQ